MGCVCAAGTDLSGCHIPVEKKWIGTPPGGEVTIKLKADGVLMPGKTLVLNHSNNWKGKFADLDKYKLNGEVIKYEIEEVHFPGYKSTVKENDVNDVSKGFTVTNVPIYTPPQVSPQDPPKIDIKITKEWIGKIRDSITVNLYADGKKIDSKVITKEMGWEYTFKGLDKEKDGRDIVYTIEEEPIKGYDTEIEGDINKGFKITNEEVPENPDTKPPGKPEKPDEIDPNFPEKPNPSQPKNPESPSSPGRPITVPQTGEGTDPYIYVILLMSSFAGLSLLRIKRRYKKERNR